VLGLLEHLTTTLGPWTYAIVGALVFMETVAFLGLLAPGEVTLAVGGIAAANGDVALLPILGIVWACGILGDLAGYTLGRRCGWSLLHRVGPRVKLTAERLDRLDAALTRWGGKALVAGRFVGPVRVFAPFAAGTTGMPRARLIRLSIVGVGLWGPTLVLGTYLCADVMRSCLQAAGYAIVGLVTAAIALRAVRRRRALATAR
jgi:membrane protein DedA with SNARE-associated domain